nr:MAG TPA: hypothetical protein [Caudoviricetes sp.]
MLLLIRNDTGKTKCGSGNLQYTLLLLIHRKKNFNINS